MCCHVALRGAAVRPAVQLVLLRPSVSGGVMPSATVLLAAALPDTLHVPLLGVSAVLRLSIVLQDVILHARLRGGVMPFAVVTLTPALPAALPVPLRGVRSVLRLPVVLPAVTVLGTVWFLTAVLHADCSSHSWAPNP